MPPGPFRPPLAVLDAPSNLGLMPPAAGREPGVRYLPDALRAQGLLRRLGAADAGRVPPPPYAPEADPDTGIRNAPAIAAYTRALADALGPLLDGGAFPLVLGGDCSVLLGSALALKRRGRFGLVFVDGHQDLLTPETSRSKGAAGMDLALACGLGPRALTAWDGLHPLVEPRDVLLLGDRSGDGEYPDPRVQPLRASMWRADLAGLRRRGIWNAVSEGLAALRSSGVEMVWIHLDVDVLDHAIMPAVDSPHPGGLTWEELHSLLAALLGSGMAAGLEVTILDPELDPAGTCAGALAAALERAFSGARPSV